MKHLQLLTAAFLIFVAVILPLDSVHPRSSALAAWGAWSCQWALSWYPVSNGYIHGRGCITLEESGPLLMGVFGDTYAPTEYAVYTYVSGWDSCDGGVNWVGPLMSTQNTDYNTNYGTSGVATGYYRDCQPFQDHRYGVLTSHMIKVNSNSNFEGTSPFKTW